MSKNGTIHGFPSGRLAHPHSRTLCQSVLTLLYSGTLCEDMFHIHKGHPGEGQVPRWEKCYNHARSEKGGGGHVQTCSGEKWFWNIHLQRWGRWLPKEWTPGKPSTYSFETWKPQIEYLLKIISEITTKEKIPRIGKEAESSRFVFRWGKLREQAIRPSILRNHKASTCYILLWFFTSWGFWE